MNAPARYESFLLEDGEIFLEVIEDTKIPNAATFKILKQDHTLANMVRAELLTTPSVLFAGYKLPHPLEPVVLIKIQTDGTQTPTQVLEAAIMSLIAMIGQLQDQFKREFSAHEVDPVGPEDAYGVVGVMGSGTNNTGGGWGSGRDYMDF